MYTSGQQRYDWKTKTKQKTQTNQQTNKKPLTETT